jgi:hypothetical protein
LFIHFRINPPKLDTSLEPMMKAAASLLALLLAPVALAQPSNIDASNKWSWGENIGFMNWRDAGSPSATQGVLLNPNILSGLIWCENVGYLNLGDGTPASGSSYGNILGTDFGVNLLPDDRLGGLAWAENIGWVNFGPHTTLPDAQQARYDAASARLRGYAWGENVGWISLDDATHFVGTSCSVDFNCDGFLDFFDYDDFVAAFEAGC